MGKFIKTALVFMGGMTAGGYCVVNAALKSQTFTTALKDAITKKTVDVLYGSEHNRPRRKVSYASEYDALHTPRNPDPCYDLIFEAREDAENVLNSMADIIEKYGIVSLADVYDIVGKVAPSYAANKHGWTSVSDGQVVRCRNGYFIKLPRAVKIG